MSMIRYMVSYWTLEGPSGNKTWDTPEEAMKFITAHSPYWRSFSTFTYEEGQAVGELTPYNEEGFNRYSWETPPTNIKRLVHG
jgi:hypothetical protein